MAFILTVSLVFCMFSVSAFTVSASNLTAAENSLLKIQVLDCDGDGTYTTDDAATFLKAAAGIIDTTDEAKYDLNGDGTVSVADAQKALRVVSGIEPVLTDAEALELFNAKINTVKTVKPGFEKTATVVCPSIKVTTIDSPIKEMNVTDLDFDKYVDKLVKVMNTPPYSLIIDEKTKAELKEMQTQAKDVYKPKTVTKTVSKTSNAHFTYFPVDNLGWSSKLTINDVASVTCTIAGGSIIYTVNMDSYNYVGDEYPTGAAGFSKRQALPYGKIFNIPSFDESDGSTVNKVSFKDGVIVLKVDFITGDVLSTDYAYTYEVDVTGAKQAESSMIMKTKTTANVTENYIMNRVTVV